MDREKVLVYADKYCKQQLTIDDIVRFLSQYALDRGKSEGEVIKLAMAIPMIPLEIDGMMQTALNWYKNKYHITVVCEIIGNNQLKPIKFL